MRGFWKALTTLYINKDCIFKKTNSEIIFVVVSGLVGSVWRFFVAWLCACLFFP